MLDTNFIKKSLSIVEGNILFFQNNNFSFGSEAEKEYFWLLKTKIFKGMDSIDDMLLFNFVSYLMDSVNKHVSESKSVEIVTMKAQINMLALRQEFKEKIGKENFSFLNVQILKHRSSLLILLKDVVLATKIAYKLKGEKVITRIYTILRAAHEKNGTGYLYDTNARDMAEQIHEKINKIVNDAKYWRIDSEIQQAITIAIMRELSRNNIKQNRVAIAKEMVDKIVSSCYIY